MKNEKLIIIKDNNEYSLTNLDNYKPTISLSVQEILGNYLNVVMEYIKYITDKIRMNNNNYNKFIIERGLHTISHVFQIIFYYTKNLQLSVYHTQKAYYFYVEFIEQITDDNITFLKLSSRDAILFVYKRTLFEINNEIKKNYTLLHNDKIAVNQIANYISVYKNILHFIIYHKEFNKEYYMNKDINKIEEVNILINKSKIKKNYMDCIFHFTIFLTSCEIAIREFYEILIEFINELLSKKMQMDEKKIINKISQINLDKEKKVEDSVKCILNVIFSNDEI
jgi:hypothetical protein